MDSNKGKYGKYKYMITYKGKYAEKFGKFRSRTLAVDTIREKVPKYDWADHEVKRI